jgi:hypothetical protein
VRKPYHRPVPLSCNLRTLTSWNPLGHSRPVTGLLYLFTCNTVARKMYNIESVLAHHSVHRESILKKFQQDDTLVQYFIISCKSLYMFRVKHSPIIRSSIKLYLQYLVLTNRVWPAVVPTHPRRRPATLCLSTPVAVNTV